MGDCLENRRINLLLVWSKISFKCNSEWEWNGNYIPIFLNISLYNQNLGFWLSSSFQFFAACFWITFKIKFEMKSLCRLPFFRVPALDKQQQGDFLRYAT